MWDLLAGQSERGERARWLIDRSIAPVWEANHVWLIFVLVVLWTAFPTVFSAIMTTLYIPLLAALGIVLRGRDSRSGTLPGPVRRPATRVFGVSSVLTPFFMGTVVGAVASGEVCRRRRRSDRELDGDPATAHRGDVRRRRGLRRGGLPVHDAGAADEDLQDYFRDRAFVMAVIGGVAAVAGIFALNEHAEYVYDGLTSWPGIVLDRLRDLRARRPRAARHATIPELGDATGRGRLYHPWGYFAAAFPYMLPTEVTISDAAAVSETLTVVIVVFLIAAVAVVPSLILLYVLSQRQALE